MRGSVSKKLRRMSRLQMFKAHKELRLPLPETPEGVYHQYRRVQKTLKRKWKRTSFPKSLTSKHALQSARPRSKLRMGWLTRCASAGSP